MSPPIFCHRTNNLWKFSLIIKTNCVCIFSVIYVSFSLSTLCSCLVRWFKNASTLVFNAAKWAHFVDQLSHKYTWYGIQYFLNFPGVIPRIPQPRTQHQHGLQPCTGLKWPVRRPPNPQCWKQIITHWPKTALPVTCATRNIASHILSDDLKTGQRVTHDVANLHINFAISRAISSRHGTDSEIPWQVDSIWSVMWPPSQRAVPKNNKRL